MLQVAQQSARPTQFLHTRLSQENGHTGEALFCEIQASSFILRGKFSAVGFTPRKGFAMLTGRSRVRRNFVLSRCCHTSVALAFPINLTPAFIVQDHLGLALDRSLGVLNKHEAKRHNGKPSILLCHFWSQRK